MDKPINPIREQEKQDAADVRKNYTRAPNMLIFGYPQLSPQEKWLYFSLIHLCGKNGTRYLSLRFISEQTGISVGALSSSKDKKGKVNEGMVRHLHDAGLIHAEIKRKDGRNNAQFHITITDVWALNQEFFEERKAARSDFGQDEDEATEQPVRISDAPVQISDKPARNSDNLVQISDEPVRKPVQIQDYSKTINKIEDKTDTQEGGSFASSLAVPASDATASATPALSQDVPYVPDLAYSHTPAPVADEGETDVPDADPGHAERGAGAHAGPAGDRSGDQCADDRAPAQCNPVGGATGASTAGAAPTTPGQRASSSGVGQTNVPQGAHGYTQGASSGRSQGRNAAPPVSLTLMGQTVRESYELIRVTRLRMTGANVRALNTLGDMDGMSFENLKEVIEQIEADPWVSARPTFTFDVQDLASEDGKWRFDRWYPVVLRNRQRLAQPTPSPKPAPGAPINFTNARFAAKQVVAQQEVYHG